MAVYDMNQAGQIVSELRPIYNIGEAGEIISEIGAIYDNDGTVNRLIYSSAQYLFNYGSASGVS